MELSRRSRRIAVGFTLRTHKPNQPATDPAPLSWLVCAGPCAAGCWWFPAALSHVEMPVLFGSSDSRLESPYTNAPSLIRVEQPRGVSSRREAAPHRAGGACV